MPHTNLVVDYSYNPWTDDGQMTGVMYTCDGYEAMTRVQEGAEARDHECQAA